MSDHHLAKGLSLSSVHDLGIHYLGHWRTEEGAEGAIRPGRHSKRGGKKGEQEKKGKRKEREREKRKKQKIWEKHVKTVKLKWNILAAAHLCT